MVRWVVGDLRDERPGAKLVVMGRLPDRGLEEYGLHDAHARAERAGRGNVRSRAGWRMRDRIAVDTALPTYQRRRYAGGTSYALPVYVYLE